jgi:AbrB family looped-hinge helix DNA binding protein
MRATGIIKRVDDLGRIEIPKEIRRKLQITVGDPLEIFISEEGKIVLIPYQEPNKILNDFIDEFKELSIEDKKAIVKKLIEEMG